MSAIRLKMLLWNQTQVSKTGVFIALFKWMAVWLSADMRASVSSCNSYEKAGSDAQDWSVPHDSVLSVCLRYNAPAVVFLRLPPLLAQPLRGAAVFRWQDVLQGVWFPLILCRIALSRERSIFFRCACFSKRGKHLINDKRNYSLVAWWSQSGFTFPPIMFYWCCLL